MRLLSHNAIGFPVAFLLVAVTASPVQAQAPAWPAADPDALAGASRSASGAQAAGTPIVTAGPEGFALQSADGSFRLRFRGYVQTDGHFFVEEAVNAHDTFVVRRARPIMEVTVFDRFDFKLMPDFGLGQTVLFDAYLELRFAPALRLRAGKFKPPVGLERLVSATDLVFVERALPTALVPGRDVGLMVSGDLSRARVSYAAGLFNGVPDGTSVDVSDHDGKEVDGRVFVRPFAADRHAAHDLGVGLAGSWGRLVASASPDLPLYRTEALLTFLRYRSDGAAGPTFADGRRYRVSAQGYYYRGPFGVLAEQVLSSQRLRRTGMSGELRTQAWQTAVSYVITGERASSQDVVPARPFDTRSHQWGALRVKFRVSELGIDDDAFPLFLNPAETARVAREWATGVNWYLNRVVKVMADYEHTRLEQPDGTRKTESVVLTRLQFAF